MNSGLRTGLKVVGVIVLVVVASLTALGVYLGRGVTVARERIVAKAAAFCAPIAIGSEAPVTTALRFGPHADRYPDRSGHGVEQWRYQFWGGLYDLAECRVTVDARHRVVAKSSGWIGTYPRDPAGAAELSAPSASAGSAPASS